PGMPANEQMAALQVSTALHLLEAGANMLLMYSGALGQPPAAPTPATPPPPALAPPPPPAPPVLKKEENEPKPERAILAPAPAPDAPRTSAAIVLPASFKVPLDKANLAVRTVTLGGSGTRTSAVTIGGAAALPF